MNSIFKALLFLSNFVFTVIILAIVFRLALLIFAANPETPVVNFVYDFTAPLIYPFAGIFPSWEFAPGNFVEISSLVAVVAYAFLGWLMAEFIAFISPPEHTVREERRVIIER